MAAGGQEGGEGDDMSKRVEVLIEFDDGADQYLLRELNGDREWWAGETEEEARLTASNLRLKVWPQ